MSEELKQTTASRRQELEGLIACDVQLKRYYLSTHNDREGTLHSIASLRAQAAKATAEADRLQDAVDNAMARYREADDRIMGYRKELNLVAKADDIAKLERAIRELAELTGREVTVK